MNRIFFLKDDYRVGKNSRLNMLEEDKGKKTEKSILLQIKDFKIRYDLVHQIIKYDYADDNDELGTGSGRTIQTIRHIEDGDVFIVLNNAIVGLAVGSLQDVVWFKESRPGERWNGYWFVLR